MSKAVVVEHTAYTLFQRVKDRPWLNPVQMEHATAVPTNEKNSAAQVQVANDDDDGDAVVEV
mgnify:CR=1 FL=1